MTHTQTTCLNRIVLRANKKLKQKLLTSKRTVQIETFNVRTFNNRIGQLPDLTESAIDHNIDMIYIQEHRYTHSEDKYHSIEKIQPRMMVAIFNGNPNVTIIGYSPTNVSTETDLCILEHRYTHRKDIKYHYIA